MKFTEEMEESQEWWKGLAKELEEDIETIGEQ
jgi:hypothetical protein